MQQHTLWKEKKREEDNALIMMEKQCLVYQKLLTGIIKYILLICHNEKK